MTTHPAAPRLTNLTKANQHRTTQAATRTVTDARRILKHHKQDLTRTETQTLTARTAFPTASLAAIARQLGITKDAYARRLARTIQRFDP